MTPLNKEVMDVIGTHFLCDIVIPCRPNKKAYCFPNPWQETNDFATLDRWANSPFFGKQFLRFRAKSQEGAIRRRGETLGKKDRKFHSC